MSDQNQKTPPTCPFLGMVGDEQTHFSYPEAGNLCKRPRKPEMVSQLHQASFCLSENHISCPVYASKNEYDRSLPKEISADFNPQRIPNLRIGLLALLIIAMLALAFWVFSTGLPGFAIAVHPSSTPTTLPTPLPSATATIEIPKTTTSPQPTFTVTASPTTTPTPQPTRGPGLSTPFGPDKKYLVHLVIENESLFGIAQQYKTTEGIIRLVNFPNSSLPVWPGKALVILPGKTDIAGLTPLMAVEVTTRLNVMTLVQIYGVNTTEVRLLNGLGPGDWIEPPRWIILPVK